MRKVILFWMFPLFLFSCNAADPVPEGTDLRQEMRNFVLRIASASRLIDPDFIVIPQNGVDLVVTGISASDPVNTEYLATIDGVGQEGLLYGFDQDDEASPSSETEGRRAFLEVAKANGVSILVTDYCSTPSKIDDSYLQNGASNYISFAANESELNQIPSYPTQPFNSNANDILSLDQAQNYLYLLNTENFSSRQAVVDAIVATDYDLVIMDLFFSDGSAFTATEVEAMHTKANGRRRLLVAYMSIGEAEESRYYWQSRWKAGDPSWLGKENKEQKGNYQVNYWDLNWQDYIFWGSDSYVRQIIDAGFDGTYLDLIDAFEDYEE